MKVNDLSYKRRSWIHKCHKLGWIPIKHHLNERLPYNLPGYKCCDIIYDWSWKEKCLVDLKQLFLWHSFTNCEKIFEAWFDLFSKNKQIIFNVKNKATRARHFHTLLVKITVIKLSSDANIKSLRTSWIRFVKNCLAISVDVIYGASSGTKNFYLQNAILQKRKYYFFGRNKKFWFMFQRLDVTKWCEAHPIEWKSWQIELNSFVIEFLFPNNLDDANFKKLVADNKF